MTHSNRADVIDSIIVSILVSFLLWGAVIWAALVAVLWKVQG